MSETFTKTGLLFEKQDTKQITEKFKVREFVLHVQDTNPDYDQYIPFQLKNDKCNQIDAIEKGSTITVKAFPGGRKWQSPDGVMKYFAQNNVVTIETKEIDIFETQFPSN